MLNVFDWTECHNYFWVESKGSASRYLLLYKGVSALCLMCHRLLCRQVSSCIMDTGVCWARSWSVGTQSVTVCGPTLAQYLDWHCVCNIFTFCMLIALWQEWGTHRLHHEERKIGQNSSGPMLAPIKTPSNILFIIGTCYTQLSSHQNNKTF